MSVDNNYWYAVYTKPRWEKKVSSLLTERGIEAYCPLNRTRKRWSDRMKWVEEPLFKSYVFVNISIDVVQPEVRLTSGVLNFVYWMGKPAKIMQADIDRIKRFLNEYENVAAEPLELKPGDAVLITSGALMEKAGKVVKRSGNTVTITIDSLGYSLTATVDKRHVVKRASSMQYS
ncbi:MAG: UpxY family transcription antiterminator [Bacteroidetes bacterium]|nr:UpxY family transcription antiterminator [Bacteroidota bacterium]